MSKTTTTGKKASASHRVLASCLLLHACGAAPTHAEIRIGTIDPAAPAAASARNAAAQAFAQTQGKVLRIKPHAEGGWQTEGPRVHAPEEFDVLWYHEGDDPAAATLPEAVITDLVEYLEAGGVLLLSGAAGRLVNDLGIEPTPLRVLGTTAAPYVSGLLVKEKHRKHPIFDGLDTSRPILLTGLGGNSLADFYDTAGPHGELLAEGNAGLGERPLVEYTIRRGRVILVGWRLPDFTTADDAYRPNLERFFANILRYLSDRNTNRARMVTPAGKSRYTRLLGVPFLRAAGPLMLDSGPVRKGEVCAVVLQTADKTQPGSSAAAEHPPQSPLTEGGSTFTVGSDALIEQPLKNAPLRIEALALTLLNHERPVAQLVAARKADEAAEEQREREQAKGLKIVKPDVKLLPAPLKPLRTPKADQSVLLGRSPFMAPGDGKGDIKPVYEPIEDGGFSISGSTRQLNRPIAHGQNRVWTGDVPLFRMDTTAGNGAYSADRIYPLWPRPDVQSGSTYPCMGTLRLGVPGPDGKPQWMEQLKTTTTTFRPGYTEHWVTNAASGWRAYIVVAPAMDFHGMICRVEFEKPTPFVWQFGGIWWQSAEANANRVELSGGRASITEPKLPNALVLVGWDGQGEGRVVQASFGQQVEFDAGKAPRQTYHIAATWGVSTYDQELARKMMDRLNTPATAGWPGVRDRLKESWFDCYIKRALNPEANLGKLLASPGDELERTQKWWDRRREEFQIRTPDDHLNGLINWSRCITEYHRQGPGLVLGGQYWIMYSHISTGWYGKQWAGDHQAMDECLRLYGAMQRDDGFIRWISPSLFPFDAENNTPYWVDQVWWQYAWTGDRQFVRDLWPLVRKAVEWQRKTNDPDGDGLFQDWYEYWNCDSNGKGPKAAAPSAMSWAMFDRAAKLAAVVGDAQAERDYRALADKTRQQVFTQLWRDDVGVLGSIGADDIWRSHVQVWEEYLAINAGLLDADRGRRAMRWLASHYGFEPTPGVKLLACSDWFPIRWSTQWVPTGDTCLAALGGMKSGDADVWWAYLKTVIRSSFKSDFPGINMGISNAGAGGGDREDVDSVDPHAHVAVRGLFGIEPALHEGRLSICPAFPSDWQHASIRTPDVKYEYQREGDRATFRIRTPRPTIKHVRANLTGKEVVTPSEKESVVTVPIGPAIQPPGPLDHPPTILHEQQPPTEAERGAPLKPADRSRQVLFDLRGALNLTLEEMTAAKFIFDYEGGVSIDGVWKGNPHPISSWWGNPKLSMSPSPRVIETSHGVTFLTAGRPKPGINPPPKNMLALSSWRPYPLPAGAVIPVGVRCERLWLLLQNYVHPMKNYIPNGEVVLRYAGGHEVVESLIPPFNLDCYFQHFSRKGVPVPLGKLGQSSFIHGGMLFAHADALEIPCDGSALLESIELRATCSEGLIGLVGMTMLTAAGD